MSKNTTSGSMKIIMPAAVIACIAVMILSAAAASTMYIPSEDHFTSGLCRSLALLCEGSGHGLSRTQLDMIENAEVKSIRYDTDSDGNRLFSAKLVIFSPEEHAGVYSDHPADYLQNTVRSMFDGSGEEIEIIGLCSGNGSDNSPVVDIETLDLIAQAAENAWENETLSSDKSFEYALTDMIIPEPFPDRVFSEGGSYQSTYSSWLDELSGQFAQEGLTVTKDGGKSGEVSDIRAAMEQVLTPYLCSVRNISLARSKDKKGYLTLSFDSLDVIGTLSTAKKPSVSALNKLCSVYSDEKALKVSIDIDLTDFLSDSGKSRLPFFNVIRAITRYGSSIGVPVAKVKMPSATQVIAGKSNGQWPVEFKRAKGDGNIIVNVIKIDDSGAESSVLKLFLTDGGKITVCLSKGRYRLHFAVGSTYYGFKEYFGANGIYMRDTKNIYTVPSKDLKTITVEKQPAESLKFTDYLLGQGIDPALIDKSDF